MQRKKGDEFLGVWEGSKDTFFKNTCQDLF